MGRPKKKPIAIAGAPHSLFRRLARRRRAAPLTGADHNTGNRIRELLAFLGWLCAGALAFLGLLARHTLAFLGWLWDGAVAFARRCRARSVSFMARSRAGWRFQRLRHKVDRIPYDPHNPYN